MLLTHTLSPFSSVGIHMNKQNLAGLCKQDVLNSMEKELSPIISKSMKDVEAQVR